MASICKNVLCNGKHIFRTQNNVLFCENKSDDECILESCYDFDAVSDENNLIHIVAADGNGNLIYIRNMGERWGKGIISHKVKPQNIFVILRGGTIEIFYVSKKSLFSQKIDAEIKPPYFISKISAIPFPFVTDEGAYYVSEKGVLCRDDKELCEGSNITHLFADGRLICIKETGVLKLFDAEKPYSKKLLTEKHGTNAEYPILSDKGQNKALCWIDGNSFFSASYIDDEWHRLKEIPVNNFERIAIYKFCFGEKAVYDMGYMKNGRIIRMSSQNQKSDTDEKGKIRDENRNRSGLSDSEQILSELCLLNKKMDSLNEKIEKFKENWSGNKHIVASKNKKNRNLYKLHKK